MCEDSIWGVRKAALQVLPDIALLCPDHIKNGDLIEIFKKLSNDSSKWVKQAAFQILGKFIVTYSGKTENNHLLLEYYINMGDPAKNSHPESEIPYQCAYNFPAVLFTMGSESWPKLKQLYLNLTKDGRYKVRRTLAFSLHEIAKILGAEKTEKELIGVFI